MAAPHCILVVEDEAVVAKDLQTRLKKLGYHVPLTVPTGEEAIARVRELRPSLVLMDIRLKGELDGIQTAARIQADQRTPIIYLTAYADEGTLDRAKVTEPFGYVLKPFNERELHTAIQVAIFKHGAEAALRKSERWLAATLRGMGDAVIAIDVEGKIAFMNPLAQLLTGWEHEEAAGRPLIEVFRVHDAQTGRGLEAGLLLSLQEGRSANLAGNVVLTTRRGPGITIEDSVAPIRDDEGNVSGGVLVFRDVTQRKLAEEALRLSEQRFRLLVEGVKEYAIFLLDEAGNVESWNPGIGRITGYSADDVLGKPFAIFYSPEDVESGQPEFALKAAARDGSYQKEGRRLRKDGSQFLSDVVLTALKDSAGRLTGFAELTRDITERRRAEEEMRQVQKLESLGVLAGGIAHDFNNLLTGILGNCSFAMEDLPHTDPRWKALQDATHACVRAAQLTQQLLSYAGKGRLQTGPIDLSELVREISALVRTSVPRHVGLQLDLDDSLPSVEGDSAQLQQVIMNLVINAAEAMEGLSGAVLVKTRLEDSEGGRLVALMVKDMGCGIDKATMARIFDPFFTTKFQGRGLGLAAVQGIVRGHNGTLTVESTPGKGSTFTLRLPALASTARPAIPVPNNEDIRGTETILIIDDEEMVRETAGRALAYYGYTPVLAEDGPAALEIMRADGNRFAVVVLDLTMPGMSGAQVLPLLRAINSDVPVIVSTGYGAAEAGQLIGQREIRFLQKPYTAVELARKIRRSLKPQH
jgi:PAS domain S-box-containing protein